jgi:hypothetical protein
VTVGILAVPFRGNPQAKEPWSIPGGACDRAGDSGEARVSGALPDEAAGNDRDRMPLALVLADQHGTGLESPVEAGRRVSLSPRQAIELLTRVPIQPTERFFLHSVSDHPADDIFAEP